MKLIASSLVKVFLPLIDLRSMVGRGGGLGFPKLRPKIDIFVILDKVINSVHFC
jgi:hypothetical protein